MKADNSVYPTQWGENGISVRDHIAIQAMNGLVENIDYMHLKDIPRKAYLMADAMIKESES